MADYEKKMSDLLKFYNLLENFIYDIEESLNSEFVQPHIKKLNELFEEVGEQTSLSNRGF